MSKCRVEEQTDSENKAVNLLLEVQLSDRK